VIIKHAIENEQPIVEMMERW